LLQNKINNDTTKIENNSFSNLNTNFSAPNHPINVITANTSVNVASMEVSARSGGVDGVDGGSGNEVVSYGADGPPYFTIKDYNNSDNTPQAFEDISVVNNSENDQLWTREPDGLAENKENNDNSHQLQQGIHEIHNSTFSKPTPVHILPNQTPKMVTSQSDGNVISPKYNHNGRDSIQMQLSELNAHNDALPSETPAMTLGVHSWDPKMSSISNDILVAKLSYLAYADMSISSNSTSGEDSGSESDTGQSKNRSKKKTRKSGKSKNKYSD